MGQRSSDSGLPSVSVFISWAGEWHHNYIQTEMYSLTQTSILKAANVAGGEIINGDVPSYWKHIHAPGSKSVLLYFFCWEWLVYLAVIQTIIQGHIPVCISAGNISSQPQRWFFINNMSGMKTEILSDLSSGTAEYSVEIICCWYVSVSSDEVSWENSEQYRTIPLLQTPYHSLWSQIWPLHNSQRSLVMTFTGTSLPNKKIVAQQLTTFVPLLL